MYVSLNWLNDFVNTEKYTAKEVALRLTMGSCEVEKILPDQQIWKDVFIVKIIDIKKHPNADRLSLVRIQTAGAEQNIVCGATNLELNMKAVWAPVGANFADFTLSAKDIRGVRSSGMLCSARDLLISDEHDGILQLADEAVIGTSLADYYAASSSAQLRTVFDIDNKSITHRPDMWGHFGIARELAALYDSRFNNIYTAAWEEKLLALIAERRASLQSPISSEVYENTACLSYSGISIANVVVAPSPQYIQRRLQECGLRPINNLVDISNYLMLEFGIPIHIYDASKLTGGKLFVRLARAAELFLGLDGKQYELTSSQTVIADAAGPQSLAGILGGHNSAVSPATSGIFIETAVWDAEQIHRSSVATGIRTDASQRYEKSQDPLAVKRTILRVVELVLNLCPQAEILGKLEFAEFRNSSDDKYKNADIYMQEAPVIDTSLVRINMLLGTKLDLDSVAKILTNLEFSFVEKDAALRIKVPSFRAGKDVSGEEDIVEEIGRVIGYDNIDAVAPSMAVKPVRLSKNLKNSRLIRNYLVQQACAHEILTYPLLGLNLLKQADWPNKNEDLCLANPLNPEHDRMRPSIIPLILEKVALNNSLHPFQNYRIFELGRSYLKGADSNFSTESMQLISAFYNKTANCFTDLRNSVEGLLDLLAYPLSLQKLDSTKASIIYKDWSGLHPTEQLAILTAQGQLCGVLFTVHPQVLGNFKIKGNLSIAVLEYSSLENLEIKQSTIRVPHKFPVVQLDISILLTREHEVRPVLELLEKSGIKELYSVKVLDIFTLDKKSKSLTIRCLLSHQEHTLSKEEIAKCTQQLKQHLEQAAYMLKP